MYMHMYVKCQSLSIKVKIRVRTVKISTAPRLLQYCSRTAFQCRDTVSGHSICIQDHYTVQDATLHYAQGSHINKSFL